MTDQPATVPVWQDGDPLMEAIAAAVYEHCEVQRGSGLVIDDPRNIAAAATAGIRDAARQAAGQPALPRRDATVDPAVCPRCKGDNQDAFELCATCAAAGQPDTQQQTDRATAYRQSADALERACPDGDADDPSELCHCEAAHLLRGMADEATR